MLSWTATPLCVRKESVGRYLIPRINYLKILCHMSNDSGERRTLQQRKGTIRVAP